MLTVAGGLFTFGSSLIHILYDRRYSGAGPIVEVLALGMIAGRYILASNCYNALGKPEINTLVSTIQLFTFYLLVPAAYWLYQFNGAIWAIALSPALSLPVIFYFKMKNQLFDLKKELLVLPFFIAGAIAGELLSLLVK
jgi:O-antigen/teichoic acid export membrane protein